MKPTAYLVGHSFVNRLRRRATRDGQPIWQLAGERFELYAHGVSGGSFARTLACPDDLLRRIEAIPRLPDVLLIDLGTNDLCSQPDASAGLVVENALALVDLLRRQNRMPNTVVFLSVIQRTSKGRHVEISLAANIRRVQHIRSVYYFKQAINHPPFICGDGCHLTDEGVVRYGRGLLIQKTLKEVAAPLTHIFNQSFLMGVFPDQMKIAKIVPVFKAGNKKILNNYRPISILPAFSKNSRKTCKYSSNTFS